MDPNVRAIANKFPKITALTPDMIQLMRPPLHKPKRTDPDLGSIQDTSIPGPDGNIPIRIYTPKGEGPYPVLAYFHGGGFVFGNIASHDLLCRRLALRTGRIVVSVDYRLAPEHPYPAAPLDCYAAVEWISAHMEELRGIPNELAVAGDSSGGNLSAIVAMMCREKGGPVLTHQVLIYPVTDMSYDLKHSPYHSMEEHAEGPILTTVLMDLFIQAYLGEDRNVPYASPMRIADLQHLPQALVLTAECDPLRDEGEAYAARLRDAGVKVVEKRFGGMPHAFVQLPIPEAMEAIQLIADFLKQPTRMEVEV